MDIAGFLSVWEEGKLLRLLVYSLADQTQIF